MIAFTRIIHQTDADADSASRRKLSQIKHELIAIAVMVGLLALAFGLRLWFFLPRIYG